MPLKFYKNRYARSMHEAAQVIAPRDETYEKILGSVMVAAGVASAVSFSAASAKAASLAKLAVIKSVATATAVTVGVATAGTAVIAPPFIRTVNIAPDALYSTCDITITTDSIKAVNKVVVKSEDGTTFPALLQDDGTYTAKVHKNGNYTIEVEGSSRFRSTRTIQVQGIDVDIPQMNGFESMGEEVLIRFSDEKSGVNWDSIYALDSTGEKILPSRVSAEDGYVVFQLLDDNMEVFIEDQAGNVGKSVITVSIE